VTRLRRLVGAEGPDPDSGPPLPAVVCVVGFKDSGKTGIAVRLVQELRSRGYRVAAVKHGHRFRLDTPGTDSWRLGQDGGADPVLLAGPQGFALMGAWGPDGEADLETLVRRHLLEAEIVVAEGFKHEPFPKIEVHRIGHHPGLVYHPSAPDAHRFLAVVTDTTELDLPIPLLSLDSIATAARLGDLVEDQVMAQQAVPGMEPQTNHGKS
jgi:molybdopterin-guanine dinucleotide biosynthesis protein MobB